MMQCEWKKPARSSTCSYPTSSHYLSKSSVFFSTGSKGYLFHMRAGLATTDLNLNSAILLRTGWHDWILMSHSTNSWLQRSSPFLQYDATGYSVSNIEWFFIKITAAKSQLEGQETDRCCGHNLDGFQDWRCSTASSNKVQISCPATTRLERLPEHLSYFYPSKQAETQC